jgi:hypothetical protein
MIHENSHVARRMIENLPPKLLCRIVKIGESFVFLEGEEKLLYFKWDFSTNIFKFSPTARIDRVHFVLFSAGIPLSSYMFIKIGASEEFWVEDIAMHIEKLEIRILHG